MADPQRAEPVKLLVAVLMPRKVTTDDDAICRLTSGLAASWGKLDFQGPNHAFDATDYYAEEMGEDLVRRIVAFERLFPAEEIGAAKHRCNELEVKLLRTGESSSSNADSSLGRVFNLDIGYLDHAKLVLASMKAAGQKIYLGAGVYADPIARYEGGRYHPFSWTFPDFRDGRYNAELNAIRGTYLTQLKTWRNEHRD